MTTISEDAVVRLRGDNELRRVIKPLFTRMRTEFVCAAVNVATWPLPESRRVAHERVRTKAAAGLSMRKLFNPDALHDDRFREHLHSVSALNAEVRISRSPLAHETIIVDRTIAILADGATDGVPEYAVVRTPSVVAGVHALFRATWDAAPTLASFEAPPPLPDRGRDILRTLATGHTDEAAARGLGLSVRTYRRRIAEIMTALGADSRFQAGTRAQELGLV